MADIDPSKYHYYDQPQQFTINLYVTGTASLTVSADSEEEARAKAEEIIDADDFEVDLEEAVDVDINYISKHPTRMYLIRRDDNPNVSATSKLMPGDEPREPDERDRMVAENMGYAVSWKTEEKADGEV